VGDYKGLHQLRMKWSLFCFWNSGPHTHTHTHTKQINRNEAIIPGIADMCVGVWVCVCVCACACVCVCVCVCVMCVTPSCIPQYPQTNRPFSQKEPYISQKETHIMTKRDLHLNQKALFHSIHRQIGRCHLAYTRTHAHTHTHTQTHAHTHTHRNEATYSE